MKMKFIGDIHGKFKQYSEVASSSDVPTVQVGDFGVGFDISSSGLSLDRFLFNEVESASTQNHRFIRGNHDSPAECKRSSHWIPDGTVERYELGTVMYMGGALSIDRFFRTEDEDWWRDEELSVDELAEMVKKYVEVKPRVLVTHDCAESVAKHIMIPKVGGYENMPSRTRDAIEVMYAFHKPEIHIFGHWHADLDYIMDGTRLICLGELSEVEIDL